ncbi:MAG: hypothetical protein ACLGH0_05365 [Thermoanaerobaculia bacterium]
MKKVFLPSIVLLLLAIPAFGQTNAVYCYDFHCQYLEDEALEQGTTYWNYSTGSGPSSVLDTCAWGGNSYTNAADLENGDSVFQTVQTDDFPVWSVDFDVYKTTTSVTANDYFTVYIHNYDTLQTETHYVYANQISGLCGSNVHLELSNDYANAMVRVRIVKNFYSTTDMYVDNISLWGGPF